MHPFLSTLRGGREKILDQGLSFAGRTRDAGIDLLSRVEQNADGWRRSLFARQELRQADKEAGRHADLSRIELVLLRRVDRFLEEIALRVRAQIERLGRLEMSAPAEESAAAEPAAAEPAAQEAAPEPAPEPAPEAPKKAQKASASKQERPSARKKGSTRWTMPISGYDERNVKQILAELPNLTPSQLRTVRDHEEAHKGRVTVTRAVDKLLSE